MLARLLPDDAARGSDLDPAPRVAHPVGRGAARRRAGNWTRLADGLDGIEARTGRRCGWASSPSRAASSRPPTEAVERLAGVDTDRLGVCLDLCHLAVRLRGPARGARPARAAPGCPWSRPRSPPPCTPSDPADPATPTALAEFDEARFLHQVRGRHPDGRLDARDDLPDAMAGTDRSPRGPRTARPCRGACTSTCRSTPTPSRRSLDHRRPSRAALDAARRRRPHRADHLEVETYTWGVLPDAADRRTDDDLARRIAGELAWVRDQLLDLGLKEPA